MSKLHNIENDHPMKRVSSNEKSDDSKYNGLYKISSFEMYSVFSQDFPAVSVAARIKIAF
jgi:hypothetical protein